MKVYIEAQEQAEEGEFHKELVTNTEETTLTIINARLNNAKTYAKRVHYCMHEHNEPCITETIINDNITTHKKPPARITN